MKPEEKIKLIESKGYKIEGTNGGLWSFSKNGIKSVLGFDYKEEVLDFIIDNNPDPKNIFPPYKNNL